MLVLYFNIETCRARGMYEVQLGIYIFKITN